jgi:hypothetical protein
MKDWSQRLKLGRLGFFSVPFAASCFMKDWFPCIDVDSVMLEGCKRLSLNGRSKLWTELF